MLMIRQDFFLHLTPHYDEIVKSLQAGLGVIIA